MLPLITALELEDEPLCMNVDEIVDVNEEELEDKPSEEGLINVPVTELGVGF